MKKVNITLSKVESAYLAQLSDIVLHADEPTATLEELSHQLSAKYKRPIFLLQNFLTGDFSKANVKSQWAVLNQLANHGEQPNINYINQYPILAEAQQKLQEITPQKLSSAIYFALLLLVYVIVFTIYQIKVLPVFYDLFASVNAELPAYTQLVLGGGSGIILEFALWFIVAVCAGILPWLVKNSIRNCQKLPKYLLFFPTYKVSATAYYHYLWSVYARVYLNTNEDNPLQLASENVPNAKISNDELILLKKAQQMGRLSKQLSQKENELLVKLKSHIKVGEIIINILITIVMLYALSAPIIAMYLPIFQMGAVVS